MTRSLPATIALPPSTASMLATRMKRLASLAVCGSRSTKHFWLLRMVARITSGGIARNASSNAPISTTGHSTRPATSSSSPSSSTSSKPCAKARFFASVEDRLLAPLRIEHDLGLVELGDVVVEAAHLDRRGRHEAVAARGVARRDAVDRERHDLGLLGLRPERGDDRNAAAAPSRARRASPTPRPSASTSARENRG